MKEKVEARAAVSVSDMARMVCLSRARFYQLVRDGVFPPPEHDLDTCRPFYGEEGQRACLEVRRKNLGVNGRVVLFYARRSGPTAKPVRKPGRTAAPKAAPNDHLIEAVRALGLTTAAAAQVGEVVAELYPLGTSGVDDGEVIRAVFLALQRRNRADKPGR